MIPKMRLSRGHTSRVRGFCTGQTQTHVFFRPFLHTTHRFVTGWKASVALGSTCFKRRRKAFGGLTLAAPGDPGGKSHTASYLGPPASLPGTGTRVDGTTLPGSAHLMLECALGDLMPLLELLEVVLPVLLVARVLVVDVRSHDPCR